MLTHGQVVGGTVSGGSGQGVEVRPRGGAGGLLGLVMRHRGQIQELEVTKVHILYSKVGEVGQIETGEGILTDGDRLLEEQTVLCWQQGVKLQHLRIQTHLWSHYGGLI